MKRLFVLTIKYIPIIQLIGMLINNSLYTYDINIEFDYIGDFLLGNSIVNISMLYVCSFTFGFYNWHRHIITANLINIIIATIDKVFHIPVTDIELLSSYYIEEANKEAELFKKFQIATQANPNLTYAEFIKTINGK